MFPDLAEQLHAREQQGLRRFRQVVESPQASHITIAGCDYLAFSSNDYLGLANHPDLIESACEGVQRYGVGAGASHLFYELHLTYFRNAALELKRVDVEAGDDARVLASYSGEEITRRLVRPGVAPTPPVGTSTPSGAGSTRTSADSGWPRSSPLA